MRRKIKTKRSVTPRVRSTCCSLLKEKMPDIENYIRELIEARDDFGKTKGAWGVVTTIRQIADITSGKRRKIAFCKMCKEYTEPRRRLAELVISGSNIR